MRKVLLFGLILLISIPSAIFPNKTDAGRKDKVILWTRFLGEGKGFGGRSPVLDKKNNKLYISSSRAVACHDSISGDLAWQRVFEGDKNAFLTGNITLYRNQIIFGNDKNLECMAKNDGKTVWKADIKVTSNFEVASDTIYFASGNNICKVDAKTGKMISSVSIQDINNFNFITFIQKNKVVASTSNGIIILVDLAKGIIVWENGSDINMLLDKPEVCGKYLVVSGYMTKMEWMLFVDIETGETVKRVSQANVCFDVTDGRILTSNFCYDALTLEPLWKSEFGFSRVYDCFDSVFFTDYDSFSIQDWNGNKTLEKKETVQKLRNSHYDDRVWAKPSSNDGRYYLLTSGGYLVCWGNKPDTLTFTPGNDYINADGAKIRLAHAPILDKDNTLLVDPRGFLEPLGWISSHDEFYTYDWMVFHNYKHQYAIASSTDEISKQDIDKVIPATKTEDGTLMIPFDTMVSEFGLTATKDGDRYKLSYPSR